MKKIFNILILFLPWSIRRRLLNRFWGYQIDPKAKLGFSYIYPKYLEMQEGASIGHLSVAVNLDKISLGNNSSIGRANWITGFTSRSNSLHFKHQQDRRPELIIGNHSAITKKHHIDCTSKVTIGNFVTVAGYGSQLLTHSINVHENRQDSTPITIGDYCFVGTSVAILGGSNLPPYSVLGAKSLLNKKYNEEWSLYAGVPAKRIKSISKESKYFNRPSGYVY